MYGGPPMPDGPMGGPSPYGAPPGMGGYGPPMGGPPGMGAPMPPGFGASQPMPLPTNHGGAPRSKALPLVVAAGLAIGVFGGLIIINGTGKATAEEGAQPTAQAAAVAADAAPAKEIAQASSIDAAAVAQPAAVIDAGLVDAGPAIAIAKLEPDAAPAASSSSSSSSKSSSSSSHRNSRNSRTGDRKSDVRNDDATFTPGAFADSSADPVAESATLRFDVTPPAPPGLKVTVDGSSVSGSSYTLKLGGDAKKVKVEAGATGYRTWSRSYTVRRDQTIRIRLRRPKSDSSPGGLIDL